MKPNLQMFWAPTAASWLYLSQVLGLLAVLLAGGQVEAQVLQNSLLKDTIRVAETGFTIEIEKLPPPINTDEYDEISPVVSRDGRLVYFTRTGSPDFNRQLLLGGKDARDSLSEASFEALLRQVYRELGDGALTTAASSRFNQDVWQAEFARDGSFIALEHPDTPLNNALPNALAARMPETGHYVTLNQFSQARRHE